MVPFAPKNLSREFQCAFPVISIYNSLANGSLWKSTASSFKSFLSTCRYETKEGNGLYFCWFIFWLLSMAKSPMKTFWALFSTKKLSRTIIRTSIQLQKPLLQQTHSRSQHAAKSLLVWQKEKKNIACNFLPATANEIVPGLIEPNKSLVAFAFTIENTPQHQVDLLVVENQCWSNIWN